VQDLLGRDRHALAVGLLARVLPLEPAHELGPAQIGEEQALAQPQRRLGEDLHLLLLLGERPPQLPEIREALELLLRHQDEDLRQRRLALEDGLRRRAAVVLPLELDEGIEVEVLVLERVHQLVRDDEPDLQGIDVGGDIERVRVGIVIAGDLLGQQVHHRAPQVERIRDEAEEPVGGLGAGEFGGREVAVELVDDVVAHLGTAAAQYERMAPEPEPGGPLDRRHHLIHRLLELRLAPDFPRPLLAGRARGDERHEAPPRHPAHSSPFPTAALTTRATSLPVTTMPCRSSSWRSNRSSSLLRSDRDGRGRTEAA